MLLKRLEVNGFKSFAKSAALEFPTRITAIVGPNGSGKSNVADAIRWVLGEQSIKSLRGKKGEDLIFGGTPQVAKMGKASVSLVFDNRKKIFPLEFDEVIISRKIYRDGVNDYILNDSQVRLKDVIELLSKVGLGASQHHIIAQGDADRTLYASPKERKSMVEEALGLKIFELKKHEAERKLDSTADNIKQVESLRREIQPHLKYLSQQAEKMKNASEVRAQLENLTSEYVARELKTLSGKESEIKKEKDPLVSELKRMEETIKSAENILKNAEENSNAASFFGELKKLDEALDALSKKRRALEREAGRLEAETEKGFGILSKDLALPKEKVRSVLLELARDLESVSSGGNMEAVRNTIFSTIQKIYTFLESINDDGGGQISPVSPKGEAKENLQKCKNAIAEIESEEKKLLSKKKELEKSYSSQADKVAKEGSLYRQKTEEAARVRDKLRDINSEEDRFLIIKKEFELEFGPWIAKIKPEGSMLLGEERNQLRKKIERLRIRLEEAGGVDESVVREYEETQKRDEFLVHELEDLKKASESLGSVFEDLEKRIEKDFELGLSKINKLFGEFFYEIFGGGKAEIKLLKPQKIKKLKDDLEDEGWEGEEVEEEEGLDIFVDIPRKRIKSLNMLSGGERALTSIALLFAMSTVNPPPFLVLDETDAALDEANSNRYSNMLVELGKKTQLIVVTHNRETMKAADVLYGVTMGNDGVSKLLSIKFEEAEDVLAKKK
ncbi:hypothetical protein A2W54_03015 [Candidatus Giovannonibacteria bacterium RIFCSPHIGHO2_02_43_13]|uniref:RecF/RecN/SMC N-terminal domain-containing protein n=1 Tax=Candidatus Giovannonibacteria bacterium RIFCSPHIGHO2_02_43_13 TaxID=1798330 RepID=A0A1F5WSX9_9BACT|nr:MAG: Chromosome partition protein Smc [Parcubacteria group bacterium GW2011_GWA2_44_13]OGF74748.1 MAG: hypothetical protein A3E06_01845 [Candidatus Giovannonibacteria bacterium RIFCSPHIGHO2_12_FULL_44_42]OGF78737.1 MAG: hypothetical protein A2W54_03015 [Candidatus Giovannonibacteria bacterium RIFCSPHIGHO2_02_43_13]OGF97172.1 MAG: hypothetical protein A3H08_00270 [Candidatus Giovannonibacteria bacterium RIFCSPLOWO2_12_FULL_44_32]